VEKGFRKYWEVGKNKTEKPFEKDLDRQTCKKDLDRKTFEKEAAGETWKN
jgi:hypothetical protein